MNGLGLVALKWLGLAACVGALFGLHASRLIHSNFSLYLLGVFATAALALWAASFRARPDNKNNEMETSQNGTQ